MSFDSALPFGEGAFDIGQIILFVRYLTVAVSESVLVEHFSPNRTTRAYGDNGALRGINNGNERLASFITRMPNAPESSTFLMGDCER
jgi:hypothetical protein